MKTSDCYTAWNTDRQREQDGIWHDFGSFRICIARAGGGNLAYEVALMRIWRTAAADPQIHIRQISQTAGVTNSQRPEVAEIELTRWCVGEAIAEAVITGWQLCPATASDGYQDGIQLPDGSIAEPCPTNYRKVLHAFPDLLAEISRLAEDRSRFLHHQEAEAAKN